MLTIIRKSFQTILHGRLHLRRLHAKPHENRTIGIVLCKSMNKQFAEYVIQDYDKPMGVTTYKSLSEMPEEMQRALPDIDDMKKIL